MRRLLAWPVSDCWAEFDHQGRLLVSCVQGVYRLERHNGSSGKNVDTAEGTVIGSNTSSNDRASW